MHYIVHIMSYGIYIVTTLGGCIATLKIDKSFFVLNRTFRHKRILLGVKKSEKEADTDSSQEQAMSLSNSELEIEAFDLIDKLYKEWGIDTIKADARKKEISAEIRRSGTYFQTVDELTYSCQLAWRNNMHCIGKLHWKVLKVFDCRLLFSEESIFDAIMKHCTYATNGGQCRAAVTMFRSGGEDDEVRIWNPQIIRYAGYKNDDGTILGDPDQVAITEQILKLGWDKPLTERTMFDLLPIVIQIGKRSPKMFTIDPALVMEVPLTHPRKEKFASLGLKWHALPCITDMCFEFGGLNYSAAAFNGWYLNTEICRNLADPDRYNLARPMADALDIAIVPGERDLWKDLVYAELNIVIYYSYQLANVKMVDHHSASKQFAHYMDAEHREGREVAAKYSWIVPPSASSLLAFYQKRMHPIELKPVIRYQTCAWDRSRLPRPRGEVLPGDSDPVTRCCCQVPRARQVSFSLHHHYFQSAQAACTC